MELVLDNQMFIGLNQDEMLMLDGGVNGWAIASGVLSVIGGGCAIVAAVVDPEPVSKGWAVASGVSWVASGVTGIISAF